MQTVKIVDIDKHNNTFTFKASHINNCIEYLEENGITPSLVCIGGISKNGDYSEIYEDTLTNSYIYDETGYYMSTLMEDKSTGIYVIDLISEEDNKHDFYILQKTINKTQYKILDYTLECSVDDQWDTISCKYCIPDVISIEYDKDDSTIKTKILYNTKTGNSEIIEYDSNSNFSYNTDKKTFTCWEVETFFDDALDPKECIVHLDTMEKTYTDEE